MVLQKLVVPICNQILHFTSVRQLENLGSNLYLQVFLLFLDFAFKPYCMTVIWRQVIQFLACGLAHAPVHGWNALPLPHTSLGIYSDVTSSDFSSFFFKVFLFIRSTDILYIVCSHHYSYYNYLSDCTLMINRVSQGLRWLIMYCSIHH